MYTNTVYNLVSALTLKVFTYWTHSVPRGFSQFHAMAIMNSSLHCTVLSVHKTV